MKILGSEITPYKTYLNRRQFVKSSLASVITSTLATNLYAEHKKSNYHYLGYKYKSVPLYQFLKLSQIISLDDFV